MYTPGISSYNLLLSVQIHQEPDIDGSGHFFTSGSSLTTAHATTHATAHAAALSTSFAATLRHSTHAASSATTHSLWLSAHGRMIYALGNDAH